MAQDDSDAQAKQTKKSTHPQRDTADIGHFTKCERSTGARALVRALVGSNSSGEDVEGESTDDAAAADESNAGCLFWSMVHDSAGCRFGAG